MLITSDETHPTWNITTEPPALKRHATPTTTSSAPTSPLHSTPQEPSLLDPKHQHKKIKTTYQTTTSNSTPTNQASSSTLPEITNKPENRSRLNSKIIKVSAKIDYYRIELVEESQYSQK